MITRWKKEAWTPIQREYRDSKARFVVCAAGRRSGKTELSKRKLVKSLRTPLTHPEWGYTDHRYGYLAPTREQGKRIAWDDLLALCRGIIAPDGVRLSELRIKTIFGSELWILGMDKPSRFEGLGWDGVVCDEFADFPESAFFRSVYPALTDRKGWAWLIGVPKISGKSSEVFRELFYNAKKTDKEWSDWASFTWHSSEVLPEDEIHRAREFLPPKVFAEQFEASWETAGGVIYDEFSIEKDGNIRECKYNPDLPITVASDFNISPMAWLLCHHYEDERRIEVFGEIFLRDVNTRNTLDYLWGLHKDHKAGWIFYGDATCRHRKTSASQSDYDLIRTDTRYSMHSPAVTRYENMNPTPPDRFCSVNGMLHNAYGERRLHVDPKCKKLIKDFRNCTYVQGKRSRIEVQTPTTSHLTSALGYMIHYEYPIWKIYEKPVERGRFLL